MDLPIILLGFLIFYFITLCFVKKIGIKQKIVSENCSNCCPKCYKSLERIRRKSFDHFINLLTFQMFDFKRYNCNDCDWQGLRWENKF